MWKKTWNFFVETYTYLVVLNLCTFQRVLFHVKSSENPLPNRVLFHINSSENPLANTFHVFTGGCHLFLKCDIDWKDVAFQLNQEIWGASINNTIICTTHVTNVKWTHICTFMLFISLVMSSHYYNFQHICVVFFMCF